MLLPEACGWLAAAIGLAGVLGWILDVERLRSVLPGLFSMRMNTAVTTVVAGAALVLRVRRAYLSLTGALAWFVLLVGVVTLVEHAVGRNLGIDELIVHDHTEGLGRLAPGRMAPHTALSFAAAGAALLGLPRPARRGAVEALSLLVTLVGFLTLLGFLYNAPELHAIGPHVAIALHGATSFVALGVGLILAIPGGRIAAALVADDPSGLLARRLLPAAVLSPLVVGGVRMLGQQAQLYDEQTGVGIATLGYTLLTVIMIWWSITEQRRAAQALAASAREKGVLLKEIHHRVKNNLQVIASLLYLQGRHAANRNVTEILRESRDRVYSMALIHEMLYRSHDLAWIDFGAYLASLTGTLRNSLGIDEARIQIEVVSEDARFDVEHAMPCALIANELVSNAFKHAFPGERSGCVRVSIGPAAGGSFVLEVRDDGVGIPPDFEVTRATTLGMQLVSSLTDQLHGTLELGGGPGTRIRIVFPSRAPASGER